MTISLLQKLKPFLTAKMLKIPGISWHCNFTDPHRQKHHDIKMQSKELRPKRQMEHLGIAHGHVLHIDMTEKGSKDVFNASTRHHLMNMSQKTLEST